MNLARKLSYHLDDIKQIIICFIYSDLLNEDNFNILCHEIFDLDLINKSVKELDKIGLLNQKTFIAVCKAAEYADDIADLMTLACNSTRYLFKQIQLSSIFNTKY